MVEAQEEDHCEDSRADRLSMSGDFIPNAMNSEVKEL